MIVGTLAVGDLYIKPAAALLTALAAQGHSTLAVTDCASAFPASTVIIPWYDDAAHIWHSKRHVVRACLERADTCYFLDADHALLSPPRLQAWGALGGHSQIQPLELFRMNLPGAGALEDSGNAAWLDRASAALGIKWRRALWWGDSRFAVSGGACALAFCDAWDRFVAWMRENPAPNLLLGGDGIALALAALAARLPLQRVAFDEILPVRHAAQGVWRTSLR